MSLVRNRSSNKNCQWIDVFYGRQRGHAILLQAQGCAVIYLIYFGKPSRATRVFKGPSTLRTKLQPELHRCLSVGGGVNIGSSSPLHLKRPCANAGHDGTGPCKPPGKAIVVVLRSSHARFDNCSQVWDRRLAMIPSHHHRHTSLSSAIISRP